MMSLDNGTTPTSNSNITALLEDAQREGVAFLLENGQLRLRVAKNTDVSQPLLDLIRQRKEQIIAHLQEHNAGNRGYAAQHRKIHPLDRNAVKDIPLSFAQERLWFIDKLQGSAQYHLSWTFRVKGVPDPALLENAFRIMADRHQSLRTVIREKEGEGYQQLLDAASWKMDHVSSGELSDLQHFLHAYTEKAFNLAADYMFRVLLVKLPANEYRLLLVVHHIAFDGWSVKILVDELAAVYGAAVNGAEMVLPALSVSYADYAVWQRGHLSGEALSSRLAYWKQQLEGAAPLALITDFTRPKVQSTRGGSARRLLGPELMNRLRDVSGQENCTLFMTLLTAFSVLLYRYTGQQDICIGTPVAGRQQQETEGLIGFFVNTLATRSRIDGKAGFRHLLQQVKQTLLQAFRQQDLPFEKIVQALGGSRDMSYSPVFQAMFALQQGPEQRSLELGGMTLEMEEGQTVTSLFDLHLDVFESAEGLQLNLIYCADLLLPQTAAQLLNHYEYLLRAVAGGNEQPLALLPLLSRSETAALLYTLPAGGPALLSGDTVVSLFRKQAVASPDATALMLDDRTLSYGELDALSDQLARYLQHIGVKAGGMVPLCAGRSFEMIIGILGILKAGGAYVPIDPDYPQQRIAHILEDTASACMVAAGKGKEAVAAFAGSLPVIDLDDPAHTFRMGAAGAPESEVLPVHLAYVIYTSGSTGKPKGVMIGHAGVANLVMDRTAAFRITAADRILFFSSYCFDVSVEQLFLALANGAVSVLVTEEQVRDARSMETIIARAGITHMQTTPGFLEQVRPDHYGSLRNVSVAGELCRSALAEKWKPYVQFYNEYGPTEATIVSTVHALPATGSPAAGSIPIGRPVAGTTAYILDEYGQPVPKGVAGELYLGGVQVARGYLGRPELTAERFVPDTFSGKEHARLYRTGDRCCWLHSNEIMYLGRMDDQLKIRGYRIEAGEVESALLQAPGVKNAAVLGIPGPDAEKRLVAYVVAGDDWNKATTAAFLHQLLPAYMIPSIWVQVQDIPLTANGKTDRQRLMQLPLPEDAGNGYEAPRNEKERMVAAIWEQLLGVSMIGIHDNFFERGGHSLLANRVMAAINKEMGLRAGVKDIFTAPTIAGLSALLDAMEEEQLPAIAKRPADIALVPLSYAQERLWFIDKLQGSIQYNMHWMFRLTGELDVKALDATFREIVNRHEVLRTVIKELEGIAYQCVMPVDGWQLQYLQEQEVLLQHPDINAYLGYLISQPYDLAADQLLKVTLIRLQDGNHIMLAVLHHIAFDGWSASILVQEMITLYHAFRENIPPLLPNLNVQYLDYAFWQRHYLTGSVLDKQLHYWKRKLHDTPPLLLPADYPRPLVQSTRGDLFRYRIAAPLTNGLRRLSQEQDVTLFMTLLAAFKVLLYRYTGQEDICVGIGIANRTTREMEDLIGFFVNALAIRSNLDNTMPFTDFLARTRSSLLEAYTYQDAPFEKVVEAVMGERNIVGNPLFQVMFILQNIPDIPELDLGNVTLSAGELQHSTALFDLTFAVTEREEGLDLRIEYCTDLFHISTIERMVAHYEQLLQSIITGTSQQIAALRILTAGEEKALLQAGTAVHATYPGDKTILNLFEAQAHLHPCRKAVEFEGKELTYRELNERSNQLGHYLQHKGVKPDMLVPVSLHRSADMIIAILGILKAGGAYVPVDPEYPQDRIDYIMQDTAAPLVVTTASCAMLFSGHPGVMTVMLDRDQQKIAAEAVTDVPSGIAPHNLAYVIYTSGSTGRPKGVLIAHRNVVRLFETTPRLYDFHEEDVWVMFHSFSFDFSVWEMYGALFYGGKLIIVPRYLAMDSHAFANLLSEKGVTILNQTPGAFYALQEVVLRSSFPLNTRYVIFGGEALSPARLKGWSDRYPECRLINMYGITETTVHVTYKEIGHNEISGGISNIGTPIPTLYCYILDASGALMPVGIPGELYVGGAGLARGYLSRDALTKERFISDPFSADEGARLYKTGDLARWLPDGSLEYLGRLDNQVKIRGYRIELGEVENVINQLPEVAGNCVLAGQDAAAANRLVSYFVPEWHAVKAKEKELYLKQVQSWKELYETEYSKTEQAAEVDEEFNIIGWNDSFTGGPIPGEQMREWLADIRDVILSVQPKRVLEIGCGTGLIYYQLSDHLEKYIGFDLSASSVSQIRHRISKGLRHYCDTELAVSPAHNITLAPGEVIDTVILNSIIQYFPGEQYLTDVIANSILLLNGKGRIIMGDIRDNRLLRLFKQRLLMQHLHEDTSVSELLWRTQQDEIKEEELCLSPAYFYALPAIFPEITHVDIQWKQGRYINELTAYRYTVTVYLDGAETVRTPEWQRWQAGSDQHIMLLLEQRTPVIALSNIPNPRLWKERLLQAAVDNKDLYTVGELNGLLAAPDQAATTIDRLLSAAAAAGYNTRFLPGHDPLEMHLVLDMEGKHACYRLPADTDREAAAHSSSNVPLFSDICLLLQHDIRNALQKRLPEYMIPAEITAVPGLPLTVNGKVDRKLLKIQDEIRSKVTTVYREPQTPLEKSLAAIWKTLLQVDKVGLDDNFFELGGHSLLATRVISAIRKELGLEVSIKQLFLFPSVSLLAAQLRPEGREPLRPAIVPADRLNGNLPLSFSQERLWFIDKLQGSVQFNMPWVFRLHGTLNIPLLEAALRTVVDRHEVLRTVIREHNGEGCQVILPAGEWKLEYILPEELLAQGMITAEFINGFVMRPYDLSGDHMLKVSLVKISAQEHLMAGMVHHIAFDEWSVGILVREWTAAYVALLAGLTPALPALPVQYADYACWQRRYLSGENMSAGLQYWTGRLEGVAPLALADGRAVAPAGTEGGLAVQELDSALLDRLQALSQQEDVTLFMTLLSAFATLLYRYTGQEDICIGTSVAGRQQQETEGLIGFFVNMLALRMQVDGGSSFSALLQQVKLLTLDAYEHQDIPFGKIVEALDLPRETGRNPLFQVTFILHNTPAAETVEFEGIRMDQADEGEFLSEFDLCLEYRPRKDGGSLRVTYRKALFDAVGIKRLLDRYERILYAITDNIAQPLAALQMLSVAEQETVQAFSRMTVSAGAANGHIVAAFREQVERTPAAVALVFEEEQLTYAQLDKRSGQMAAYLQQQGVQGGAFVGLALERSPELIISILGILKAGGAYVPLDPSYPAERLEYMIRDSGVKIVLADSRQPACKWEDDIRRINVDELAGLLAQQDAVTRSEAPEAAAVAYLMYTSGSTGQPKGSIITHGNVVSLVKDSGFVDFYTENVLLSTGSPSFDATTFEYWGMLLNGGRLVLSPLSVLLDATQLKTLIRQQQVKMMWFTAGWFNELVDTDIEIFGGLSVLLVGGDRLSPSHIKQVRNRYPGLTMINGYGPTENTTFSMTYCIGNGLQPMDAVPVGRPLANRSVYILDVNNTHCGIALRGEICVGGAGLSAGYWQRPELTAEKYFSSPLYGRLYRTGDMGCWLPDGNVAYLGRKDDQVKIRGYRVEPGEIAQQLQQAPGVQQAVVLVDTDAQGSHSLEAYVLPGEQYSRAAATAYLKEHLPDYMMPAIWVEVDHIPLTSNGKVDRRRLPAAAISTVVEKVYEAPATAAEQQLAEIWQELLETEPVSRQDNFFDLGGHSLLAIRLISSIRVHFDVELPIREIFDHPVLADMAGLLPGADHAALLPGIQPSNGDEPLPLSFSQDRLWFIDRLQGSRQYHMPWMFTLEGPLNIQALETAFREIIRRHAVLRTVIRETDGVGYQEIRNGDDWQLQQVPREQLLLLVEQPYDLSEDSMLRVFVARQSADRYEMMVMLHHIAFDGWSASIMVKELLALYKGIITGETVQLPALPVQYADYAVWQRRYLSGDTLAARLLYWVQKLQDLQPLDLLTDYHRPSIQSTSGAAVKRVLSPAIAQALTLFSQQEGSTLFMTLLAAFKVLLYRYTWQEDICVGSAVAGRRQQETEGLIGFFVNTLALRTQVTGGAAFREVLQAVRQTTLEAYEHQDLPFEKIVEALGLARNTAHQPVFQIMFSLQNMPEAALEDMGDVRIKAHDIANNTSRFDLHLDIVEAEDGSISMHMLYCTALFREATVRAMLEHYENVLVAVLASPELTAGEVPLLSQDETYRLKEGFNDTAYIYPKFATLTALFEARVQQAPGKTAVVAGAERISYHMLHERSGQLAAYLSVQGILPGDRLGLLSLRGIDMITGMLGILKAGAVYVPLNTAYPPERLRYVADDAAIKGIVYTDGISPDDAGLSGYTGYRVQDACTGIAGIAAMHTTPDAGAYIMYTSGTTGKPKGILVSHRNIIKLVHEHGPIAIREEDRVLQWSNYAFDGSVYEIYSTLLNGATLHMIPETAASDVYELSALVREENITVCFITTALFNTFIDTMPGDLAGVRKILFGGEMVSASHVSRAFSLLGPGRIVHVYGPTETTVYATFYPVNESPGTGDVPIGKGLDNTRVLLLDACMQPVPVGVAGEIYIGGDGVAAGYTGNAALTAERFVVLDDGTRWYRTGDYGRWLHDGNIVYLGRKDDQVKIRGYRIEPGEIGHILRQCPGVQQGVVLVKDEGQDQRKLVAFVQPSPAFDKNAVMAYLREELPEYMVPAVLTTVEHLPLNTNGKVDRALLLQQLPEENIEREYVAPRDETERRIAAIWEELLRTGPVGIHDNFFELGGHSLLAMRVIAAIRALFNREIRVKALFMQPTVEGLSAVIKAEDSCRAVPPVERYTGTEKLPLSFAQERLWFIDRLQGSVPYHMIWQFRVTGTLDIAGLESAFREVLERHQVLRTVIAEEDGVPYQQILAADGWRLQQVNGLSQPAAETYLDQAAGAPFDLSADYMLRTVLASTAGGTHTLLIVIHHIAFDGWSVGIMVEELSNIYRSRRNGKAPVLKALPVQYADYAVWQRTYLAGEISRDRLAYWTHKLQDVAVLELPTEYARPQQQGIRGGMVTATAAKAVLDALQALSLQEGVTLFMTLMAAFKVLLYRYAGQVDICVGTPVAGRGQQETEGLLGFFVNTLAIRSTLEGTAGFSTLLQQVKQTTLDAYEYQDLQFEKIVEALGAARDMSHHPVFQVMFSLQNMPPAGMLDLGDMILHSEDNGLVTSRFELSLDALETAEGLALKLIYNADLFSRDMADRLLSHYVTLLEAVAADPEQALHNLPLATADETEKLLHTYGNGGPAPAADVTLMDLFEQQVKKDPAATALILDDQQLSYAELDKRASQLAAALQGRGIKQEDPVIVCAGRSMEMIIALLGILKAGGVYVPVSPSYPKQRIRMMLEDAGAAVAVCAGAGCTVMEAYTEEMAVLTPDDWNSGNTQVAPSGLHPACLAYVIYTSGSAGTPKGVMVEHRSLVSYIRTKTRLYNIGQEERILQFSSYGFDASLEQIFLALLNGAILVLLPEGLQLDTTAFTGYLARTGVTHLHATPGFLEMIAPGKYGGLRRVVAGGEVCKAELAAAWLPYTDFYNKYGPTEATITVTEYKAQAGVQGPLPIGKPLPGVLLRILDAYQHPVPVGVPGELYAGGVQVARGYLHQPEQTAARFLADPFSADSTRLYRTGDICKWLPDGNILFLGRKDEQVKIRGYRIETGDVEQVLSRAPGIKQAVVMSRSLPAGGNMLVAYTVPETGWSRDDMFAYLRACLPDYMIPSVVVPVETIPLTANGKTDRRLLASLPLPEAQETAHTTPRNELEQSLMEIWEALLGIRGMSIHSNFFELGGHSLMAMRVVAAIRKQYGKEIPVKAIFEHPDIAGLAAYIGHSSGTAMLPGIKKHTGGGRVPLSSGQMGLWLTDRLQGSVPFHMIWQFSLSGRLDLAALDAAFNEICRRHEVLRTVIREEQGIPYQLVLPAEGWKLLFREAASLSAEGLSTEDYLSGIARAPFDLASGPVLRVAVVQLSQEQYAMLIVIHHIAFDGWSIKIIVEELTTLYDSYLRKEPAALKDMELQYADYAVWQQDYLQSGGQARELEYWKQQLQDATPLLLPVDGNRSPEPGNNGALLTRDISPALHARLLALSAAEGVTLYMTLLAALNVLLYRYSGQQDIIVGSPVAGRKLQETETLLGFFVNTLVLRNVVDGDQSFREFLQQVKKHTLNAFEHQEVPYFRVIDALGIARDLHGNRFFQVMFAFQNAPRSKAFEMEGLQVEEVETGTVLSRFELHVNTVVLPGGELQFSFTYNTGLFREDTISGLLSRYIYILEQITCSTAVPVDRLRLLRPEEETSLLAAVNSPAARPLKGTVVALLGEQAALVPDHAAVVFENTTLTYRELDERSNQLAHYLRDKGVTANTMVPLCMERSAEMMVGIMGILKAGAAYVPMETDFPPQKIAYMLQDTGAGIIVSDSKTTELFAGYPDLTILKIDDAMAVADYPVTAPHTLPSDDDLLYVIYTSGSTGKPKGVLLTHGNMADYISGLDAGLSLSGFRSYALMSSITADAGKTVIFGALCTGGTLHMFSRNTVMDAEYMLTYFEKHRIDFLKIMPAHWKALSTAERLLLPEKVLMFGGELLEAAVVNRVRGLAPFLTLINHYGPTETTVGKLMYKIPSSAVQEEVIPIGKPFPGTRVYVLNQAGMFCPAGVPGELYIGGKGIAKGYLNNEQLTAERFVPDPYTEGGRLYRTGDLVKYLQDGNIIFLGRVDDQVKINGYRIEPGEISVVLNQHENIKQAVVVAIDDKMKHKRLVAYVVSEGPFDRDAVIDFLQQRLPGYMIPAAFVPVDLIPLGPNGKVDRKRLPEPEIGEALTAGYVPPVHPAELDLAHIWSGLLGAEKVGIHDNFFELGGDSIIAIQVVSRMKRLGYDLQPYDMFRQQTIARLAAVIRERQQQAPGISAEQGVLSGACGLLPVQHWYFEKELENRSHYNQSVIVSIDKRVAEERLQQVTDHLLQQHDALRFVYKQADGQWEQYYGDSRTIVLTEDLQDVPMSSLPTVITEKSSAYQRSLDILSGRLVQVVLMKTPAVAQHNRLLLVVHHLAIDGVSWRVILEDMEEWLSALEDGQQITPVDKGLSYREWYNVLADYGSTARVQQQLPYWQQQAGGYRPLPTEKPVAAATTGTLQTCEVFLGKAATRDLLKRAGKAYHTEVNDLLLAALLGTLHGWLHCPTLSIGLEGHGREPIVAGADISRTVGWCTNLYPVLLSCQAGMEAGDLLKSVKEQLRRIPDKGMGYGVLKYLDRAAGLRGRHWDIMFNYLGQLDNVVHNSRWFSSAEESPGSRQDDNELLAYTLSVNARVEQGQLAIGWNYSALQYERDTIARVANDYIVQLEMLVQHCLEVAEKGSAYTPADFGLSREINYQELDSFLRKEKDTDLDDIMEF